MHQPFDVTTIVFAILAVFVVWKLRSVLGTRTGSERPPYDSFAERRKANPGNPVPPGETGKVIRLPGAADDRPADQPAAAKPAAGMAKFVSPDSRSAAEGLAAIAAADPSFSAAAFIEGARAAYEMIIAAFAAGNRDALAPLLAKDVLDGFSTSIAEREAKGHKVDTTFVSMGQPLIEDAGLRGRTAHIAVKFRPQMITVTRDAAGAVVDGSPDQVADVTDLWTFARDVDARDPNWKLVATETLA